MELGHLPAVFGLLGLVAGFYFGKWWQRHKGENRLDVAKESIKNLTDKK